MKMAFVITAIATGLAFSPCNASQFFEDSFEGGTVNESIWSQRAVSTPGGMGSISVSNSQVVLKNRGTLISRNDFSAPLNIYGSFKFAGTVASDRFAFFTRTTGESSNPWADIDDGLIFRFQQTDINGPARVAIDTLDYQKNEFAVLASTTNVALPAGQWFNFRITDDGDHVALYFQDVDRPLLQTRSSFSKGNKIAFNNGYGGNVVAVDYVRSVGPPGLYTEEEYNANRTRGQTDVTANPSAFNLFTREQYESFGRAQFLNGRTAVIANPPAFGLISRTNIPPVRIAALRRSAFKVNLGGRWDRYTQSGAPKGWKFNRKTGELSGSIPLTGEHSIRLVPYKGSQAGPQMTIKLRSTR